MTTMDLLELARRKRKDLTLAEHSRRLKYNRAALNQAMQRGHLSPRLAIAMARDIGEDWQKWGTIAAMENNVKH